MSKESIRFTANDTNYKLTVNYINEEIQYFLYEEDDCGSTPLFSNNQHLAVLDYLIDKNNILSSENNRLKKVIESQEDEFQRQKEILEQDLTTDADDEIGKLKAQIKRLEFQNSVTKEEKVLPVEEEVGKDEIALLNLASSFSDVTKGVTITGTIMNSEQDKVNHPNHYNSGGIETIDYIESVVRSSNMKPDEAMYFFNVCKYISRSSLKNGLEDLNKAEWYLNRWIGAVSNA